MRRILTTGALTALGALVFAGVAAAQTVPAIPVDAYGDALLSGLGTAVGQVLPYAAAVTVFAIGVGLITRYIGRKKATRV